MTGSPVQSESILAALEQLLEWPEMARSPQLQRFLDYIVRRTLDGDVQSIKAYAIAVDVFGRAPDFDPQADPIVRVQARRLRTLLSDYYRGPGADQPVQIRLPVGRYVPEFVAMDAADAAAVIAVPEQVAPNPVVPQRRQLLPPSWFFLLGIAVLVGAVAIVSSRWVPEPPGPGDGFTVGQPSLTIVEFQDLSGDGRPDIQVGGLAIELMTDLNQFADLNVQYGGINATATSLPQTDFTLTGIVRLEGDLAQYSALLTDNRTGVSAWNQSLAVPVAEAVEPIVLDHVSNTLSLVLGSSRGPLHADARQLLLSGVSMEGKYSAYICHMLFSLYRETGATADAGRAQACLASLSAEQRQHAPVVASEAILKAEMSVADETTQQVAERLAQAQAMMDQAIKLDALDGFVWEQQARLHEISASFSQARVDYAAAVQLNPASSDALAGFARFLAFAGRLDEAEVMAKSAVEGSPNPPGWYFAVPALLSLRDGRFAQAVARAERYANADRELGPILAIMAAQAAGAGNVVNRYLPQVFDMASFRAMGVIPRLRQRISDDALLAEISAALVQAGVPTAALEAAF